MVELFHSHSESDTIAFAANLAKILMPSDVVAFRGGLGVGKTAFVRGLCKGLGIVADVSSPTFALVHEYHSPNKPTLCHFDMYRVNDPDSLETTGFYDYLDCGCILAIEWSEQIVWAIPNDAIVVEIKITGESEREISVTGGRMQ